MTVIERAIAPAPAPIYKAPDLFTQTQEFWQANRDLLPEGVGTVAMLGVSPSLDLIDIRDQESGAIGVISLILDARQAGSFTWQLMVAKTQQGAEVYRLDLQENQTTRSFRRINVQGSVGSKQAMPKGLPWTIGAGTLSIANHPLAVEQRDKLRLDKVRAQEDLAKFEESEAANLAGVILEKRREGLQRRIDNAVLTANKPLPYEYYHQGQLVITMPRFQ
jgi:hypothetical protein